MMIGGDITEIVGPLSSGRSSLLVAGLRDVTRAGSVAALVDVDHAFDPASAAAAGVDLRRLLWVRCGGRRRAALRAADLLARCPGFALVALDLGESPPRLPLTAAFRLRLAARRTGAALVVLASRRIAGAAAGLVLETSREAVRWGGPGAAPTRLARVETRARVVRRRGSVALPSDVAPPGGFGLGPASPPSRRVTFGPGGNGETETETEARHGLAGACRRLGHGGHSGPHVDRRRMSARACLWAPWFAAAAARQTETETEARHGLAGACRRLGAWGPFGAPMLIDVA